MKSFEKAFVEVNKWALVLMLTAMSVIVFANVSLRYTTNFSLSWAEEVARYLMIWMTFIGAGMVLRVGGHVAITNLHDVLPSRAQLILRGVVALILLAFFCLMIWIGYDYMSRMGRQMTPATRIPFSYVYAAMPIGFALLVVHFLLVARTYLAGGSMRDGEGDAVATQAASG